jgi:type I restriction enzyme S subunit
MTSKIASWSKVKLRNVLSYTDELVELDDETEFTTITVKRRHGGLEAREKLFGSQIRTKKQFKLIPGAFIISRIQCWHQAYAIVPETIETNMIASTNYDQFIISPEVDKRFFWWLSFSPIFTELVRSCAFGVVIEKMVFNRDAWLDKTISIPPLSEQWRIVGRIEELAAKIKEARGLRREAVEEANALVNASAQRLLADFNVELTELRYWLDETRDGIQTGPFGAQLGSQDFESSGVPILTIGNIQYHGFELNSLKYVSEEKAQQLSRYSIKEGDILFARMGTVGRCCVVPQKAEGWLINYHLIRVALDRSRVDPRYIHWWIRASREIEHYLSDKIRGATREGVNSSIVSSLPVRIPPLAVQHRIVLNLDDLQTRVDSLKHLQEATATELDALIPSILDKAFKGEL